MDTKYAIVLTVQSNSPTSEEDRDIGNIINTTLQDSPNSEEDRDIGTIINTSLQDNPNSEEDRDTGHRYHYHHHITRQP